MTSYARSDSAHADRALAMPALTAPIVSTQWLADHLGADGLVVADATVLQVNGMDGAPAYVSGDEEYMVHGHIPGAVFADLIDAFSDPDGRFGFAKPSKRQFEHAAADLGVDNRTTLIVYDNSVGQWASRLWWLFRAFGYDQVAVLDGGLHKWTAEHRPTGAGYVAAHPAHHFTAHERQEFWADKASVSSIAAGKSSGSLVCGLPAREFRGETSAHRARAGHIPHSISAPASRLVDRDTNAYLPPDALRALFADVPADATPVVAYCAAGIAAASDALALAILGRTDVAIYDGSLNEWAADADAQLVTMP